MAQFVLDDNTEKRELRHRHIFGTGELCIIVNNAANVFHGAEKIVWYKNMIAFTKWKLLPKALRIEIDGMLGCTKNHLCAHVVFQGASHENSLWYT